MFKFLDFKILKRQGFTLIEILTAITLFTFLIMAALGIYLTSLTKHRQALKSQVVNEDLQYATELMYQDIRKSYLMASGDSDDDLKDDIIYLDHPTKNTVSGSVNATPCAEGVCNQCSITEGTAACKCCLQYHFNSTANRIEMKSKDEPGCNFTAAAPCVPITSSRIVIESFNFDIPVIGEGDIGHELDQPRITILIRARERDDVARTSEITLQTQLLKMRY